MQTLFSTRQLAEPRIAEADGVLRKCVHCGFCTATCPTYVLLGDERDSPRGRIYLIKEMLEQDADPTPEVVRHLDRCLSCLACTSTCPSGVDYGRLIDTARTYIEKRYERPFWDRFWRAALLNLLPYPGRLRAALALRPVGALLLPAIRRISALKPLAAMLALSPPSAGRTERAAGAPAPASRGSVILLKGCVESVIDPEIRAAAVRLLSRMGFAVREIAGEGCCGALAHHMGRHDHGEASALKNLSAWSQSLSDRDTVAVLTTASGCGLMLKDYGRAEVSGARPAEGAKVSELYREFSTFLLEAGLPERTPRPGLRVAYQAACSLQHGHKVLTAPKMLLEAAGFAVSEPREAHLCCGSAGTYNILQSEISGQLRDRKLANLEALEPDVIVSGNIGCLTQLGSAGGTPVVHLVQMLDWATGGPRPKALSRA